MICRRFSELYSAFLDGVATSEDRAAVEEHLRSCIGCHRLAAELRCLRFDISSLERDAHQREYVNNLNAEVVSALHREARWQAQAEKRRADFIDRWRIRIFSQSVGTLVSIVLLGVLATGVLRPAYRATLSLARVAMNQKSGAFDFQEFEAQFAVAEEVRYKILLLGAPPPPPVFNPSGAVLGFGEALGDEEIVIATVKVRKDGRASVTEVVDGTDDPVAIDRLSDALIQQANFRPKRRRNHTEAVLMFSKINISG